MTAFSQMANLVFPCPMRRKTAGEKAALRRTYFGKSLFISSSLLYNSIVFGGIAVKGCKGHLPPFCANMEVRRAVVIHLGADKPSVRRIFF